MKKIGKLEEAVIDYFNSDDRFAMQIDGGWGTGKTYYIRNTVVPAIEQKEEIKSVYVSVFGFDNLSKLKDNIRKKIISECISLGESKGAPKSFQKRINMFVEKWKDELTEIVELSEIRPLKGAKTIFNWYVDGEIEKYLRESLTDNKVILFLDDLERLSKKIEMTDLLGFIQAELLDDLGLKIVIISNSSKIKKGSEKEYNEYREKVMNKNFTFRYEYSRLLDMVKSYTNNDFVKTEIAWIGRMIQEVYSTDANDQKGVNLRTVFAALSNFTSIEKKIFELEEIDKKHEVDFQKNLFLNTLIITHEYRENNFSNKSGEELSKQEQQLNTNITEDISTTDTGVNVQSEQKAIETNYSQKGEEIKASLLFHKSITRFILHGEFITNDEYNSWKARFHPEFVVDPLEKLIRFYSFQENEVVDIQKEAYQKALDGCYDFNELITLLNMLLSMKEDDLLWIQNDFEGKIFSCLLEEYRNQGIYTEHFDHLEQIYKERNKEYLNQFLEAVKLENQVLLEKYQCKKVRMKLGNDYEGLSALNIVSLNRKKPKKSLIDTILTNEILEEFIFVEKSKALELQNILEEDAGFATVGGDEYDNQLKRLQLKIKEGLESSIPQLDRIDRYKIKKLLNWVTDGIKTNEDF